MSSGESSVEFSSDGLSASCELDDISYSFDEDPELSPGLLEDINNVKYHFGEDKIHTTRVIDFCDIELLVDPLLTKLAPTTYQAWGIDTKKPIVIRLVRVSATAYLQESPPRVEVFQTRPIEGEETPQLGVGPQLGFIVDTYCKKMWSEAKIASKPR